MVLNTNPPRITTHSPQNLQVWKPITRRISWAFPFPLRPNAGLMAPHAHYSPDLLMCWYQQRWWRPLGGFRWKAAELERTAFYRAKVRIPKFLGKPVCIVYTRVGVREKVMSAQDRACSYIHVHVCELKWKPCVRTILNERTSTGMISDGGAWFAGGKIESAESAGSCWLRQNKKIRTALFFSAWAVSQLSDIQADESGRMGKSPWRMKEGGALGNILMDGDCLAVEHLIFSDMLAFKPTHQLTQQQPRSTCVICSFPFVWTLQATIQMSLCMSSHFCLLVLPVMSLLLFSPSGWSYDSVGLSPGCHLHRKQRTVFMASCSGDITAVTHTHPHPTDFSLTLWQFKLVLMGHLGNMDSDKWTLCLIITAFNVTIRSDRRGTCKGTHLVHACVGYCESSAFPSRYSVLVASNFTHNITSASRCCTISRDTKVKGGSSKHSQKQLMLLSLTRCIRRLPSGQSSPGLPSRSPPRRNRDLDSEGLSLRHVPQVPLLTHQNRWMGGNQLLEMTEIWATNQQLFFSYLL